jgi:isopenicillin N synthase-like dioxygenase
MEAYSTNSAPLLKLFSAVWGLDFFYLDLRHSPSETTSAAPREGHAIVNCGDALSLFTNKLLPSNVHRVASQL